MDLGLDANGQSATSKESSFLKVLEKSPVCGTEPLFQQSGHPDEQNQHVGIFLPGSLRRFRCYSVSPEQEKDKLKPKCVSSADSYPYVSSLVWAFFMCLTPLWIVISSKHPASRTLLYSGWEPVITAMVISRCVCVFSLLKEKEQLSRVCTSQRLVCMMTHPLNKLQHPSTYTLRSP